MVLTVCILPDQRMARVAFERVLTVRLIILVNIFWFYWLGLSVFFARISDYYGTRRVRVSSTYPRGRGWMRSFCLVEA